MKKLLKKIGVKKIRFYLIIGVVVFVIFLFLNFLNYEFFDSSAQLTVFYPDGRIRTFTGKTSDGMTILDVLSAISQTSGIIINYEITDGKILLNSFDGIQNTAEQPLKVVLEKELVILEEIGLTKIGRGSKIELKLDGK